MQDHTKLQEQLSQLLVACLERGMQLPFIVAAVAINGATVVARYTQGDKGLDAQVIEEYAQAGEFRLPINMMVVDAEGNAARIAWQSGKPTLH